MNWRTQKHGIQRRLILSFNASVHFHVGLRSSWKKMPTFRKTGDLRAEIQVRTVAQHIWAAASHILQYKQQVNIPPPVRRSIYHASALLEIFDLEFERVLNEKELYGSKIDTRTSNEKLNVDSLAKVLEEVLPSKNMKICAANYTSLLGDCNFERSISSRRLELRALVKHLHSALVNDSRLMSRNSSLNIRFKEFPNSDIIL